MARLGGFSQLIVPLGAGNILHQRSDIVSGCEGTFCTKGVTIGSGCASQVVATNDLGLPGSCGPSLARIVLNNWDLLSRCLFDEK